MGENVCMHVWLSICLLTKYLGNHQMAFIETHTFIITVAVQLQQINLWESTHFVMAVTSNQPQQIGKWL